MSTHRSQIAMPAFLTRFSKFRAKSRRTLPFLALVIGPLFFSAGVWLEHSSRNFVSHSIETQVFVVSVEDRKTKDGRVFRPTFAVIDENGTRIEYVGTTWVSPKPHERGDSVDGRYNPLSHEIQSNQMLEQRQFIGRVFWIVGALAFMRGIVFFWWRRRNSKTTS